MKARRYLYKEIIEALKSLSLFELVGVQEGQFDNPEKTPGTLYSAALVEVNSIDWEAMSNNIKQGDAIISIYIYTKGGFASQLKGAEAPEKSMVKYDMQDTVVNKLEGFKTTHFKPLRLKTETKLPSPHHGLMAYQIEFKTRVFLQLNSFVPTKITLKHKVDVSSK